MTFPMETEPTFFPGPDDFRRWLEAHHGSEAELLVGFHKKKSERPSITWPESVREALCFGWIDGIRRSLGEESYTIRFTPRKRGSNWSNVNIENAEELIRKGLMRPAGLRSFEARDPGRSGPYSFERKQEARLGEEAETRFRANTAAWSFFESQPPGYRKRSLHWVLSAKRPETKDRRLTTLIDDSAASQRIPLLRRPGK
ncbi:MAG: YdeI/OmpD-associated family protein [Gemmatimonadota bacterium]